MIKKFIFVVLAVFGFSAVADMHSGMDHMSDMASGSGGEESGFAGSVWLKSTILGNDTAEIYPLNYRARLGWSGDVNEAVQWRVGVSTPVDSQNFSGPSLAGISLEQAYVSWMPADGFSITAGKKGWKVNFHKKGILYDEDLYHEGVTVKYRYSGGDDMSFYVKAVLYDLNSETFATAGTPLKEGTVLAAKVGGKFTLSDGITGGVHVGANHDGLFKEDGHDATTLASLGLNFGMSNMAVPAGVFFTYLSDVDNFGDNHSFSGGVYVGSAGAVGPGEMGDFGVALSYYDINKDDFQTTLLNQDYVSNAGDHKGLAVRAQYNVWNNTNLVAKFSRNLGDVDSSKANNLVGELNFNF